ncbi:EF-hand calcium-binding domain-containing protein 12 [Protopterus annectens]|uniref:EF-hand calcium-binding domain-containing protein 12 n=1 Tax=Protopterus annectens TaxID=7888 RepID=UPI001CFAF535|nr:EF-hand calcium-binding domain-containing protein 12 [Protopterus annectens]XP_043934567.1 EF-hand calcium-binding domain-containing protein 12 [Protopterus annectens]
MTQEVLPSLSIVDQLKKYKQRDLFPTLFYKAAVKSFGPPQSRRRIIIAPPMTSDGEGYSCSQGQQAKRLRSHQTPKAETLVKQNKENEEQQESTKPGEIEKLSELQKDCQEWIAERIQFRKQLDNIGNVEAWLEGKSLLTELEIRVLEGNEKKKSTECSIPISPILKEKDSASSQQIRWSKSRSITPIIRRPSPQAFEILHHYLQKHGLRLIDLFRRAKKNKKGKMTREEFQKVILEANIPVDETQLDDLMVYLTNEDADSISFKELVAGYRLWKLENREEQKSVYESVSSGRSTCLEQEQSLHKHPLSADSSRVLTRNVSAVSTVKFISACSSRSSPLLEVPPENLEEWVSMDYEDMEEMGKRDRERRRRLKLTFLDVDSSEECSVVKTGNLAIDSHSLMSTLSGEWGESIDQYRRTTFKEYMQVLQLCQRYNVELTEKLLERVLLHPGDRPVSKCKQQLPRKQGVGLLSHAALKWGSKGRDAEPGTVTEEQAAVDDQHEFSVSSRIHSNRLLYPKRKHVAPRSTVMQLSTGQAEVQRKIDCWMTFEEYARFMRKLKRKIRYHSVHADPNAFWPGYLQDKLCIYLQNVKQTGKGTVFSYIDHKPRTDLGISSWPVSDLGYVTSGDIEMKKEYYLKFSEGEAPEFLSSVFL